MVSGGRNLTNAMPPNVSQKFLADMGETKWWEFARRRGQKRAKRELHEWRLQHDTAYAAEVAVWRERANLIEAARPRLFAAGFYDPQHVRNGRPYCACGSVDDHNQRFEELLNGRKDGDGN